MWHEDGSRRGDEEWEEHLAAQLGNSSVRWIQLNGWATTINWRRVLQPPFAHAVVGGDLVDVAAVQAALDATADGLAGGGGAPCGAVRHLGGHARQGEFECRILSQSCGMTRAY